MIYFRLLYVYTSTPNVFFDVFSIKAHYYQFLIRSKSDIVNISFCGVGKKIIFKFTSKEKYKIIKDERPIHVLSAG